MLVKRAHKFPFLDKFRNPPTPSLRFRLSNGLFILANALCADIGLYLINLVLLGFSVGRRIPILFPDFLPDCILIYRTILTKHLSGEKGNGPLFTKLPATSITTLLNEKSADWHLVLLFACPL